MKWDVFQHLTDSFEGWWTAINKAGKDRNSHKAVEFTVYLLWHIWKSRNLWHFQSQKLEAYEVVQKALQEWNEYDDLLNQRGRCKRSNKKYGSGASS